MQISTKVRRLALLILSMVFSLGVAIAQERTVTGVVTAEEEGPVPGVNVTVQGTTTGVMTGMDGSYSIKVPGPNAVLVFSSIGYVAQNVSVGAQTKIDVVLVSDVKALQEVVVTGYTVQRRRDLTGSIATVQPAELTAVPTGSVSNALQGRTSGVTVVGNGQPNSSAKVRIRGFSSFENNDPLYVVDGVPTQDINSLNPNDIESLSVLKDAGAASIYGSRASNGVIIVTTRRGQKGVKVTYNMYAGVQNPGNGPDNLLSAQEYADLQWLVYKNDGTKTTNDDGTPVVHAIYGPIGNPNPTMPDWAANTNWYKAITHKAPMQNHDLSLSGGNDNAKFFAGFGVRRQEGIVIHTFQNKNTGRFNSEFSFLNSRVKIGENFTGTYTTNLGVGNLGEGSPINAAAYRMQPIIPVKWTGPDFVGISHTFKAGDWGGTGIATSLGNVGNQVASLERSKDNQYWDFRMIGSTYLDIKLLTGLSVRSTLGGTWNNGYGVGYNYATYENAENQNTPSLGENAYYGNDWVWTNTVTLDKTFGDHKILAVAGYEAVKYDIGRNMSAGRGGYFTDDPLYRTLSNGSSINYANSDLNTPTTLESQFIRADYQFMDRYMVSATLRRDGSSRFGSANRYGVFPSFSVGWRVSDESFFEGVTFINDLKVRGSYGTMGNQLAVRPQNQFYSYGGDPGSAFYDLNGAVTGSVQGFRPTRIGNPDAKWETNVSTDIGFDATFMNNKLGFKFDWYVRKTKDLLFAPELPGTAGAADRPYINIAAMTNKGVDLELSYNNKFGDLGFNASFMLTSYKNNIDKIASGVNFFDYGGGTTRINEANRNMVGHPMSAFYGYKVIGLQQTEGDTLVWQDGHEAGFFKYANLDTTTQVRFGERTQVIDAKDRTFIGDPNPDFTYSINLGFSYKNFDLSAFVYGSQGNDIFNWNRWWIDFWPSFQGQKSTELLYNSWRPDNTNTNIPKASTKSNFSTNTQVTSYYIENGSYARLRTLELGFTLPADLMNRLNVSSLRLYVQAVNLFTITKFSGLDPELGGDDRAFGADTGNYPLVKNFLFGLNLNF
jgi:TonB-dependent starch-binding outer membrane protein SusC